MKKAFIQVPSMRSQHCQLRVEDGIKKLGNTQHLELKSGIVEIDFQDQNQLDKVQQTIVDLGYTVIAAHVQDDTNPSEKNLSVQNQHQLQRLRCTRSAFSGRGSWSLSLGCGHSQYRQNIDGSFGRNI
ncbi:MAG: heavy-metal-associated domain-containing protein [Crocinitomicaceae bacterium]|nr:heavy-metal-associated domain-containing protein [Crocinitomicaceae bacterium]